MLLHTKSENAMLMYILYSISPWCAFLKGEREMETFICKHIFEIFFVFGFLILGIISLTIECFEEAIIPEIKRQLKEKEIKRKGDYYDFAKSVKKGKRK